MLDLIKNTALKRAALKQTRQAIPMLDLFFYAMETPSTPAHVMALLIFEKPDDAGEDYMLNLVQKMRESPVYKPFNARPIFPLLGTPKWETVEELDMQYHVRHSALPAPGNMSQLMEVVQRLHMGKLDRQRPGWRKQIIEGLEGNRFALLLSCHHAYVDGVSALKRIYASLNTVPSRENVRSFSSYQEAEIKRQQPSRNYLERILGVTSEIRDQLGSLTAVNSTYMKMALEWLHIKKGSRLTLFKAPRTILNNTISSDLRSMGITSLSLKEAKKICGQYQCTINDLLLALVDAALNDYLRERGEEPDAPMIALVPMALREKGDDRATTQIATLLVELGDPKESLEQRIHRVTYSAKAVKQEAQALDKRALMEYAITAGAIHEGLARTGLDQIVPPSSNLLVSNVPGPIGVTYYLGDAKLVGTFPISLLVPGSNLNVTILSHSDKLDIGAAADHVAVPNLDYFIERLNHHFDQLTARLEPTRKAPARKPAAKKKSPVAKKAPAVKKAAPKRVPPRTAKPIAKKPVTKASSRTRV